MPLALLLAVLLYYGEPYANRQLVLNGQELELVARMRTGLMAAAEAEKSAVLATTDEESQTLADEARASTSAADRARRALAEMLRADDRAASERSSLDRFSEAFAELQRIDDELLTLAVKNTNLKAYRLVFGPAADIIREFNGALSRLVTANASSPRAVRVMPLAFGAQIAALRIQTLLPPHVAEESDQRMDEMEAAMAAEDENVRDDLRALERIDDLGASPDLATARARWQAFDDLKTQILALSRENTNVRSLSISLTRKRAVTLMCRDALAALQQSIEAEAGSRSRDRLPDNPRALDSRSDDVD